MYNVDRVWWFSEFENLLLCKNYYLVQNNFQYEEYI